MKNNSANIPIEKINTGEIIHCYKILNLLGQGGMAEVYRAQHIGVENFSKTVAVKFLKDDFFEPAFINMFVEEAKLVSNLVHENICQIYHLGKYHNNYYISMEFIDGVNLHTFIKKHKELKKDVPLDIAVFIISRLCRALEYAHNKKDELDRPIELVHSDVTPSNIMISFEGVIKLVDFGIAKFNRYRNIPEEVDKTPQKIIRGKYSYMSPEQTRAMDLTSSSDIFSLGTVMYELITKSQLFTGMSKHEIAEQIQSIENHYWKEVRNFIPESLCIVFEKSLHRYQDHRYTASEFGSVLEHFIYDKGYGPTNQTLRDYMKQLFEDEKNKKHTLYREIETKTIQTQYEIIEDFAKTSFMIT